MKKYEFRVETIRGVHEMILLEGTSQGDALANFQSNKRFVRDVKTNLLVNVDHVISVRFERELASTDETA